jgi:hypothetical protein
MLIATLVAGALVCLVLGLALGKIVLTYTALAIGLSGLVVLAAGEISQRQRSIRSRLERNEPAAIAPSTRKHLEGTDSAAQVQEQESPDTETELQPTLIASINADDADLSDSQRNTALGVGVGVARTPESDHSYLVHVVPGRRRFHLTGCRLLDGHTHEQITANEAREEGLSACTRCIPERSDLIPVPAATESI